MAPATRSSTRNTPAPPLPNMDALTLLFTSMQEQLSTANCHVAKLGDSNYTRWKRDMTIYLQDVNLWEVVTQPAPDPVTPEWTRKDRHALAIIHNCCDPLRQDLFAQCDHAHAAWAKLATTFESRDPATVQRLYFAFHNIRKSSTESMLTYISRVKSSALQLASVGEVVSRTVLFNTIISGLGDQFEAVKIYLAVDPALTEERLSQVLLAEESRLLARRSDHGDRDNDRGRQRVSRDRDRSRSPRYRSPSQVRGRGSRYCPTCDMYGHDESTCYRLHPDLLARRRAAQTQRPSNQPGDQYRPSPSQPRDQYRPSPSQLRPSSPRRATAYSTAYSMQPQQPSDSPSSPAAHSHGYALPVQLNDETVWDYYHNALVIGQSSDFDDSSAHTLDALHRYNVAIATGIACWSAQALPSSPPSATRPPQPGDYVSVPQPGQWLIDSGASNHFTSSKHLLSDYRDCPEQRILTGNGYIIAKGIGNVTLHSSVGLRTIFDVLYVPDLSGKHNLLSIPQLVRKGCLISMSKSEGCVISSPDNTLVLLQGSFTGKGFIVDMSVCRTSSQIAKLRIHPLPSGQLALLPGHLSDEGYLSSFHSDSPIPSTSDPNIALLAGTEDTQPIEIWHMGLGHLNQSAIHQLTNVATGLKIGPPRPQTISMRCESCLRGGQHKNISYHRSPGATKRLHHVWADVKGPLLEKDLYGFRYFCTFICEFTRWTVQYPLLHKNHVFGAYKLYEARYERLANEKILYLHIDGGSEYLTNDFRTYLRGRGVALSVTQPYSPEMNSIAERAMRTIIEHASAMLWNASLPVGFWSQAVETSVYLLNRSPHSALHARTPYEAWHGSKPNLGHLHIFGCRAAAHVPDELRTKTDWSSKSTPNCIFIGYSETENLFKLWDINK